MADYQKPFIPPSDQQREQQPQQTDQGAEAPIFTPRHEILRKVKEAEYVKATDSKD